MMAKAKLTLAVLSLVLCGLVIPVAGQFKAGGMMEYSVGGLPSAPVRIDVFSDYQCPACRTFYLQTLKAVLDTYAGDNRVSVVYHDFPLQMHLHAREAARYSLAARRLGKEQWTALTDALYARQSQWSADGRIDLIAAQTLSPEDYARLGELLQDPSIDETLDKELALGRELQVSSTPTFFIVANGRTQRVVGGVPYPVLESYLNRLLK
jgi:protein-disulfide isomerase